MQTTPRALLAMLAAAAVGGCDNSPQPRDLHQGGTLHLAQCGYDVTTHDGASRPVLGSNMLGADPTPKLIHLTVPRDPAHTMAVLWRTNDETTLATTVQLGVGGATDKSVTGLTFVYDLGAGGTVRMHEAHLCGLTPDTQYSYRVGGAAGGKESWSPVYTFRTAPDRAASPSAQVTFLVIGDTREGYATWGQAMQAAFAQAMPDLVLFTGDEVTLGPVQDDWDLWFAQAEAELRLAPIVVAHGNHEVSSVNFFSQFALPGDEQNFAFDFGPAHITVANDTPVQAADLTGVNAQTLDKNLKAGMGAPWNLLMNHKGMFSAAVSRHPEDGQNVRAAWQPIVDADGVDVAFQAHDHDYERSKPMRGATPGATAKDGTIYVLGGSAGAPLDPSGSDVWTAKSESTYSFAIVRAQVGMFQLTAYRLDGSMLDSFTITK